MHALHFRLLIGLTLALPMLATPGIASAQSSPLAATPPSTTTRLPIYRPPMLGAPATRVGGASRGSPDNDGLTLSVLAPESTGLTRRAQPTLYWCSSKSLTTPLEFSLNDDHSIKPLVEMKLNAAQPGIHALHLTYPLKTGVEYQWAIAAVADPNQRAGDLIAGGTIQRVEPTPALAAQLDNASPGEQVLLYAEQGFWYDALAVLSEQIDANPADHHWREQRVALLEQVGLNAVAWQDQKLFASGTKPAYASH